MLQKDFRIIQKVCLLETSNFCPPLCPSMFILHLTSLPLQHMFHLVSYPTPSQKKFQDAYENRGVKREKIVFLTQHKR